MAPTIIPTTVWRSRLTWGMRGDDVASWQAVLVVDGQDIGPIGVDGAFGNRTEFATRAWQFARGLEVTGMVGSRERAALRPRQRLWTPLDLSQIPYIQAENWNVEIPGQPKRWVVIHCMESGETLSTAENCARWFAGLKGKAPRASAHYCVDADSVVQCVPDDRVAWHAPGANRYGIGVELAGMARQSVEQWLDTYSAAMLQNAAQLTAMLCERHDIPPEFSDANQLRAGTPGITTHAEVSRAFGKSTHYDPGKAFPTALFIRAVNEQRNAMQ